MKKIITILVLIMILISANSFAADKWIFFYPGEAGSTEEADPIIGEFFDYLREKDKNLSFDGAYFNTVAEGMKYIETEKPKIGILSYSIWAMKKNSFDGAKVFMDTRPLPQGMTTEQYVLVGTGPVSDNNFPIIVSEPLSAQYVKEKLFSGIQGSHKLEQTSQMLKKLKDLSEGSYKGYAILTPMEAYTLSFLKSAWAKKIKVLEKSKLVPTARVVLFDDKYKHKEALKKTLLEMSSEEEGTEILDELRLVGFQ